MDVVARLVSVHTCAAGGLRLEISPAWLETVDVGCATLVVSGVRGQAIYFPDAWWHATLNTGPYNVFASVFTHERKLVPRGVVDEL